MSQNTFPNATDSNAKATKSARQFKRLPLYQIRPSRQNPRLIKRQEMIAARAASMAEEGQTNPIIVRPLTPQELANDGVLYEIVDGELRYWAALKNGDTEIDALIQDMSPFQAFKKGISANRINKPVWFEDYIAMEVLENAGGIQKQEIAALFEANNTTVSRALRILELLNETSRALVLQNLQKSPDSWQIAENTLYRLTDLGDPQTVETALKVVLDRQMTEPQAQGLVTHVKTGNPADTFTVTAKPNTSKKVAPKAKAPGHPAEAGLPGNSNPPEAKGETPSHLSAKSQPVEAKAASLSTPENSVASVKSSSPSFFWEWVAGISFISQIRSKLKKGETLTGGEKAMVLGWRCVEALGWFLKNGFKAARAILKTAWKLLREADKLVEKLFGKTVSNLVHLALAVAVAWGLWYGYHHNPLQQFKVMVSKVLSTAWSSPPAVPSPTGEASPAADQPAPSPAKPVIQKSTKVTGISFPSVKSFVEGSETSENLNAELAAIPGKSHINSFAYKPGAMDADMSTRRLEDLQDSEKYTIRLGQDQEKVSNIVMTASNCVLTVRSGLLGLLDNTSKIEIYWEDVTGIHLSKIISTKLEGEKETTQNKYQLTLLANGLKKPLTVQCSSPENLERLATALEFKLKTSRGATAPITAMPYLNQGLRLDKDGVVTTVWADSPIDKAGLVLGDHIWSLEKNTESPQSKADLEAGLQSLTSGPHILYKVPAAGWKRALADMRAYQFDTIRPLRRTVHLNI